MIGPALEEIGKDMQGKVTVAKINIDDNPVTPNTYGVRSIPTLMLVRDGKVVDTKVGALPKSQLKAWLKARCKTMRVGVGMACPGPACPDLRGPVFA